MLYVAPRAHGKSWLQQEFYYEMDNRESPLYRSYEVVQVPNRMYFMSPTGVREVSEFTERQGRIVMTDTQMKERGLMYDALRGGIVKFDPPPKILASTNACWGVVVHDPMAEGERKEPKKVVKKDYNTIGVRFLRGDTLHKVYTYKVRKGVKVHLGQELVARTDRGDTVVVVVEIHKTPQDTNPAITYKFIDQKVAPL